MRKVQFQIPWTKGPEFGIKQSTCPENRNVAQKIGLKSHLQNSYSPPSYVEGVVFFQVSIVCVCSATSFGR
jgi:hypothetical protein